MKYLHTLSALAVTTLAAVHEVKVGPGFVYSPDTISNAASGDVIAFSFNGGHNVASGSFDSPCKPSGGIYSGEEPAAGDVFSVTLNGTDPLWIYCTIPGHCQGGMAMVVNPPSDQTLDSYKSAAVHASSSSPTDVSGGVFGDVPASDSSSSSASSSSSSASAASSSSASDASSSSSSSASESTSAARSSSSAAARSSSSASHASAASTSTSASSTTSSNDARMTGVPMAAGVVVMGLAALL